MTSSVRVIYGAALDRLLDGDLKNHTGSHGRNYVEKLASQMLLDPKRAAELTAGADARARGLPQLKAAVDRANALNASKQALLDKLARCKDRGSVGPNGPADNFFRDMPYRLYSLRSWTKENPRWAEMEHAYLPLNHSEAPLGEEDWRGGYEYHLHANRAWFFKCDPREFGMLLDEDPGYSGLPHWNCGEPLRCLYTVRDFPDVNSIKRDREFLAVYAGRLRRLLAEATPGVGGLAVVDWDEAPPPKAAA
jgi:hypothetical protein